MPASLRPQLRPFLAAAPADREGRHYVVSDRLGLSRAEVHLGPLELGWANLFDGRQTLDDVHAIAAQQVPGAVPLEHIARLAATFDEALFLEGPRFRAAV